MPAHLAEVARAKADIVPQQNRNVEKFTRDSDPALYFFTMFVTRTQGTPRVTEIDIRLPYRIYSPEN